MSCRRLDDVLQEGQYCVSLLRMTINLRKNIILIIILFVVVFGLYLNNIHNALFWDDNDWIVRNPFVHSFTIVNVKALFTQNTLAGIGQRSNYFRPVLFLTYIANYVVGGDHPAGYHLVSNALHAFNTVLVFVLVFSLFQKRRLAFVTALLFGIHPLQTEAVTYISGRGDPLSVFFLLISLLTFLKWYTGDHKHRAQMVWLGLSLIAQILAILSREVAVVMPLFIVLLVVLLEHKTFLRSVWRAFLISLPYLAISAFYTILRLTVWNFKDTLNFYIRDNLYTQHLSFRIFTFFHALVDYVRLTFVPEHLHMERSVPLHTSLVQWPVWGVAIGLVGFLILLIVLYRKERHQKKIEGYSDFRIVFFGIGWFFVWLLPSSGIIPVVALIYEHWLYFALFGFLLVCVFYFERLLAFFENRGDYVVRNGLMIGLLVVVVLFARVSLARNALWGNAEAFYKDILRYDPESVRVHNNLGNFYFNTGNVASAEHEYWLAVKSEDIFPQPHFNLGDILQKRNDIAGALYEYEKAIAADPEFYPGYERAALIYAQQGKLEKAIEYYKKLIQLRPADPRVYYNIALFEIALHHKAEATQYLTQGLQYTTNDPQAKEGIEDFLKKLAAAKK